MNSEQIQIWHKKTYEWICPALYQQFRLVVVLLSGVGNIFGTLSTH